MERAPCGILGLVAVAVGLQTSCALADGPAQSGAARQLGDLTGPWQLFVDDGLVAEKVNVRRVYHAFRKHPSNPVLRPDRPWEGTTAYVYGTVLPAEDGAGYRMWYHSWAAGEYRILYATSKDGLTWHKPALGLVAFRGSKDNNILLRRTKEDHIPQVIHTPWEKDAGRRYKLVNYDYGRTPPDHAVSGYWGATSPDGIHWTTLPKNPILRDPGDVGNFVWDPHAQRYLGYPKKFTTVRGQRRRCCGFTETTRFEAWPTTKMALTPDEFDDRWVTQPGQRTDFYGLSGFAYESMYIGFLWIFRITDGKNDGPIFVELVSSRDGIHWVRQDPPRLPILPLGPDGAWDDGMLFTTNHPLVEGDRIRLYYGGFDVTHGSSGGNAAVGLATLRKDGFASLDAGAETGTVTTRALLGTRGPLRVNCSADRGWLKVEVLDEQGKVIPGYGREDCRPRTDNGVDQRVTWTRHDRLPDAAQAMRLRFVFENASLYSFAAGQRVRILPAAKARPSSPQQPPGQMPGWFCVTDFGAAGDGKADCTTAFAAALTAADKADGGIVWVPAGQYRVKQLTIPRRVTLRGTFEAPPRFWKNGGSVILAVPDKTGEDGRPFCIMHECAALRGLVIHYPNQMETEDPDPYPWCVRGIGDNVSLTDVLLSNPYNGIDLGTEPAGRHYLRNVNMHALRRGVFIDKCFDVGRIENVHVWPFWSMQGPPRTFTYKHGEAFIIGRTDWEYVTNCFCIGYAIGFHFIKTKDGEANGVFTHSGSDVGPLAVLVEQVQRHSGVSFANCQMMATVKVAATNRGPVKFTACGFWPVKETGPQAILDGQDTVSFNACHFAGWDQADKGEPCIMANNGSLIVSGCDFLKAKAKKHIALGKTLTSAVITANRFRGGEKIDNRSGGDVQIGMNVGK